VGIFQSVSDEICRILTDKIIKKSILNKPENVNTDAGLPLKTAVKFILLKWRSAPLVPTKCAADSVAWAVSLISETTAKNN